MVQPQQYPTATPANTPQIWNTPRRLQTALTVILAATVLFLTAALGGANHHRQALQTIGREAAPSIIGAQRIKAGLSDMDAAAADVLLLSPGVTQEHEDDHYEMRRVEVTENLLLASQKTGLSAAERKPLNDLADALGTYETDVSQARLLHLRGELGSRLVYRMTHSEMHDTILPAADALIKANSDVLEAAYKRQQASSQLALVSIWITGLLLTAILVATQIYLSRLTQRTLNVPLLGATALTVLLLLHTTAVFTGGSDTLRTVKEDAYSSISTLWLTRATAFDANSEESRWLMDAPQAPQYEQLYNAQSAQIAALPPGDQYGTVLAAVDRGQIPDNFQGDIAAKLRSIHFPGEQSAERAMLSAYGDYDTAHKRVRVLEDGGNHGAAVAYCVGEHNAAFTHFDDALGQVLNIDQKAFDDAVTEGFHRQDGYDLLAALTLIAAAALAGLGVRARLREYAV